MTEKQGKEETNIRPATDDLDLADGLGNWVDDELCVIIKITSIYQSPLIN